LSNTNQLWGLFWGIFVFHELRKGSHFTYLQVAGGSVLMALGALAIALSSATESEHSSWRDAAQREGERYGVQDEFVSASMEGRSHTAASPSRSFIDWLLIFGTTAIFVVLAVLAKPPQVEISAGCAIALSVAMLALMAACGTALWRTTRFR